jgi:hypothetical protein
MRVSGGVASSVATKAGELGVQALPILVEPDQVGLLALVELFESGKLRVHVDQTFPLKTSRRRTRSVKAAASPESSS